MSRPTNQQLLDGETTTGPSETVRARGHPNVTLAVVAAGFDGTQTLTVALEWSPRGNEWETLGTVSEADLDGSIASVRFSEVALEHLRANVAENPDELSIDAYLLLNGNESSGRTGRER